MPYKQLQNLSMFAIRSSFVIFHVETEITWVNLRLFKDGTKHNVNKRGTLPIDKVHMIQGRVRRFAIKNNCMINIKEEQQYNSVTR